MVSRYLSNRALKYPENPIRGLSSLSLKAEKNGVTVIPLNIGAPDTSTPKEIRSAGASFLQKSDAIRYGPSAGSSRFIEKIAAFYQDRLGFKHIDPSMIMVTQGASEALDLAFYTVANPGDTVLVPEPCYSNYRTIAYKYDVVLKPIETTIATGFHLIKHGETLHQAVKRIGASITKKTKAILWSSPGNPTGAVYSELELTLLLKLSQVHNLVLLADEVYRLLAFENLTTHTNIRRSPSIYDVAGKRDRARIILMDSTSKMFSFCGGRVGIVVSDPSLITNMVNQASVRGCPNTICQEAASNVDRIQNRYFDENRKEFESRRDALHKKLLLLKDIGIGVSPQPPEGAFYIVADLGEGIHADDFCRWLLSDYPKISGKKETIFLTPMTIGNDGFYINAKKGLHQVRIAYVLKKPLLDRAVSILGDALVTYKKLQRKKHVIQ